MRRVRTPALVAPALFAATALAGQTTADECDMESFRTLSSRETVIGQRVTWVGSPEVACTDGVRIRADSAVVWEADERTEFYGGFRYLDSERELEADTADYFQREGRLLARGNAELRTLDGATVVRGDTLDLYEATGGSGQERLEASGRRALALMAPADSSRRRGSGALRGPRGSAPVRGGALPLCRRQCGGGARLAVCGRPFALLRP